MNTPRYSGPRRNVYREGRLLRSRGLFTGIDSADGQDCYLKRTHLPRHVHVQGSTGRGKSLLLLWLFQLLCFTGRPLLLVDPKGPLYRMCRNWAIKSGFAKRLILFDLSNEILPGYNPLRPNGMSIPMQVKWARAGFLSSFNNLDFAAIPQLYRMAFLCFYVARFGPYPLHEAISVLRPKSALRAAVLPRLKQHDPFVAEMLNSFHRLADRRQEELAASCVARLESLAVCDPTIRAVLTSPASIDPEFVLSNNRIMLLNAAKNQPVLPDDLKMVLRFITNDFLAHVYKGHGEGKFDEEHPVYFIADEIQNLATKKILWSA